MKLIKRFLWLIMILVLIVVVLIAAVFLYADHLTRIGVEQAGSRALGVTTTLENADLSLLSGSLTLSGLHVANPPGYQSPELLHLANLSTSVDVPTVFSDLITINIIKLDDLQLTVEQKGMGNNLQEIIQRIQELKKDKPDEPAPPDKDLPRKQLRIDRIEINNAVAHVKLLPVPGQLDVVKVKLAPIIIENIAPGQNNTETTITVIRKILLALTHAIIDSGVDLPTELLDNLRGSLQNLESLVGDFPVQLLGEGGKILESGTRVIQESIDKTIEDTGDTIKKTTDDLLDTPGRILEGLGGKKSESEDSEQ